MNNTRHLQHSAITKERWDTCVTNSPNGLIYAQSWYLDAMSPGWEAIIYKDYEAIMPLTRKRKMGIHYLSQPAFSQQLGIISPAILEAKIIRHFIELATEKFSFIEINLNFLNEYEGSFKKCNLVLDLTPPFELIEKNFRKDLLRKSTGSNLSIESSEDYEGVISLFKEYYQNSIPHIKERDFKNFSKVCRKLTEKSGIFVRKVINRERQILASALFFKDEKRIYYIMSATKPEGRKCSANAFLLYEVIKEFSGSDYIFDFEGSSIPSIQFFFKKFGPVEQSYPGLRINNLPGLLKLLKK